MMDLRTFRPSAPQKFIDRREGDGAPAHARFLVAEQFEQPSPLSEVDVAGDYVPHVPGREEVPDTWVDVVLPFFADVSEEQASEGAALGSRAIDLLAGPASMGASASRS